MGRLQIEAEHLASHNVFLERFRNIRDAQLAEDELQAGGGGSPQAAQPQRTVSYEDLSSAAGSAVPQPTAQVRGP